MIAICVRYRSYRRIQSAVLLHGEKTVKTIHLLIRRLNEPLAHNWGYEQKFNEWKIISHYPTLISHLFHDKTQLLIVLCVIMYGRLFDFVGMRNKAD